MKKKCFYARLLGLLLCAVMCVGTIPAHAAESTYATSRYDFSSIDALDAYDQYQKEVSTGDAEHLSPEGTEYVVVYKHNEVGPLQDRPFDFARYGAFLRDNSEEQNFMLYNLEYSDGTLPQNVLTIYADPGVNFTLKDRNGNQIVSDNGVSMASKVNYYNKTTDNGHMVYYIEMNPDPTNACRQMLRFSTELTNTQPHYSFWFGNPVVEEKTVESSSFSISVQNPNKSSYATSVLASGGIPTQRAWVQKVIVKQFSSSSVKPVSSASIRVTLPKATKPLLDKVIPSSGADVEFINYPEISALPARGTYKFQLVGVNWKYNASSNATYTFRGQMVINYLAAFGA